MSINPIFTKSTELSTEHMSQHSAVVFLHTELAVMGTGTGHSRCVLLHSGVCKNHCATVYLSFPISTIRRK